MKKLTIIAMSIVCLSLVACNRQNIANNKQENFLEKAISVNSSSNMKTRSRTISTDVYQEYKNKDKVYGKTVHTIDLKNKPNIIKIANKGSLGDAIIYYVINNNKVDVYNGINDKEAFNVQRDLSLSSSEVPYILDLLSLEGNISDYEVIKEEIVDGHRTIKISSNRKLDYLNAIIKNISSRPDLEKNKEIKDTIKILKRGTKSYYWIDQQTSKIVKYQVDTTLENKLSYYLDHKGGTNPPVKITMTSKIDYDNVKKPKIPSNIIETSDLKETDKNNDN
ncbi:MAG: hypothetical protein RR561_01190 [Peptostreptococcus sp.]|uniref:hypothetical protein n=1 Tax=Peptostreptococcus sp. TaxID=1262 RepID=UPI002FCA06ED